VVLLSLLLLTIVSLATLTRVETSIGFNSQRQAQAKQNALFALNRAIGELQRHAGPDQRITARAGIVGQVESRYWTGVWDSAGGDERTWLVSGNEDLEPLTILVNPTQSTTIPVSIYEPGTINGAPAAVLVGANTAGNSSAQHVMAPLVSLN